MKSTARRIYSKLRRLTGFVKQPYVARKMAANGVPSLSVGARERSPATIGSRATGRHIVMLVVSDLRIDPRVEREARALAAGGYKVTVLCPEPFDGAGKEYGLDWGPSVSIQFVHCSASSFLSSRPGYYAETLYREAAMFSPFAYHAHDLNTAYAALAAAQLKGAHLVVDFHEWYSENVHWDVDSSGWIPYPDDWKADLRALEVRCLSESSAAITVCDSIADAMLEELGRRPHVVRNIPDLRAVPTLDYPSLKQQLNLPEESFVLLWQGGTGPTQLIEPIIQALAQAPDCTFVVRGPSLDLYGDGYMALAREFGVESQLVLLPAVPSRDVVAAARGADAGIWTLPALCRNFTYALPNKIFEYLAADLPVLVAHYPEAARLVSDHKVGLTFDPYDPGSIAASINRLVLDPVLKTSLGANAKIALGQMDADREWQKIAAIYDGLPQGSGDRKS